MAGARVLGVDGCRAGWVGIALEADLSLQAYVAPTIGELVAAAGPLDAVGVDIPIGLPDAGIRRADREAAAALGPRRSSVFLTPVRPALEAPSHPAAVLANRAATGSGVSIQAYGLRRKILEVDAWVSTAEVPVLEVHPELSFATLNGAPLTAAKLNWAGQRQRRALLAAAGFDLDADFGAAGLAAGPDDLLDAVAAAWSAARWVRGEAVSRPDPPEIFADGSTGTIWT